MKKLKLFLLTVVAVAGVCAFSSCKDDDDKGGASSIVGTWLWRDSQDYDRYVFRTDGTYLNEWNEGKGVESDSGTYSYDGTTLTIHDSDGWTDSYRVTISGNRLTFDYGYDEVIVYTRQ